MSDMQTVQLYCVTDRDYYEAPDRLVDAATRFPLDTAPLAPGWSRRRRRLWTELHPDGVRLPEQGWKIHISAVPDQAESTVDVVAGICLPRRVPFKFLRSRQALEFVNGKYMSRQNSGKLLAVYPTDDQQLGELVGELTAALDGRAGPYILSDLRIGRGPVYVRYGAFVEQWCPGPDGVPVPALRDPSGRLVPDERHPVFRPPSWAPVPAVLGPYLAARAAAVSGDFPYRVLRPLHFTNAGGTYLAEHRDTGEQVLLREARPHAGLDGHGVDAITRLRREYDTLTTLDGLPWVPRVYGRYTVWEHDFLVEEYIDGQSLMAALVRRNPLRFVDPPAEALAEYRGWVEKIVASLSEALDALHARGVSFGDLHPGNVIIRPDDSVVLVDFEYAGPADARGVRRHGAPGFVAPSSASGAEADRYALRSTWLTMLVPMTELAERDPGKTATLEALARQKFGLGPLDGPPLPAIAGRSPQRSSGESKVRELFDDPIRHWPAIRQQLVAGIEAAATPERTDRLFPGDPRLFDGASAGLAYGAAGVLLALHRTGAQVPAEHIDWLAAAARRRMSGRGLFDGPIGCATVLAELGRRDEAVELLAHARASEPTASAGLFAGQAGVALAHCQFAQLTGEAALLDTAIESAQRLDALVGGDGDGSIAAPPTAGLLHGLAGAALLQLRLYRITGEERFLRACRRALERELTHCVPMEDSTVQVKHGHRHLLYLDGGSGGLALVAQEYLAHAEDAQLAQFVRAVRRGCRHPFVREPGLFQGRAGLLAILARLPGPDSADEVAAQAGRLGLHAVHRDGQLLIPGRRLRRFSADLATGAAGVLLALHSAIDGKGDILPLLLPQ